MFQAKPARPFRRDFWPLAAGAMMLASTAVASAQDAPLLKIVSEAGCPLVLESATLTATADGVSIAYSIRNDERDSAREIVITAAAINSRGQIVSLGMEPAVKKIAGRSSQQSTILFPELELEDADTVSVGIQGVRWAGRRHEWRGALRVIGPTVLAAKN